MMKRSRAEQITSTVTHYLKRRQYMDACSDGAKRDCRTVCNIRELALSYTVLNNGSNHGTVSYCSSSGDANIWDQQFIRFKSFIQNAIEPYHAELQLLLYPIFVHVYLEMLIGGYKVNAHKLYERHQGSFVNAEDEPSLLSALRSLMCRDDINSNKQANEFRTHKYGLVLTEGAFQYLMKYLKHEDNLLMLQVISQRLDISVRSCCLTSETSTQDVMLADEALMNGMTSLSSLPPRGVDIKASSDISISALQRIAQKVQDGSPPLPSICLYTLLNTYQGLCNVSISDNEEILSAGFEDSRIMAWSLTPKPLPLDRDDLTPNISHIPIDGDSPENVRQRLLASRLASSESPECAILRAHSGPVYSTCYIRNSPLLLLSASADKTVRLWDIAKRSNAVAYRGHNYPVFCVDSSPAAPALFASCSFDQTAKLWSTDRIYPLRTFIGHTRSVNCVRFHANGNYLATCASDSTVRLWNMQDGQPVRLMFGHHGMVMALAFSPNGKYLASAGEDQRVKIWDLATGSLFRDLRGHTDFVYSLAFSRDSSLLASGGLDGVVHLWEVDKPADDSTSQSDPAATSTSLVGMFPTKSVSVFCLRFSMWNHLIAAGT